MLRVFFCFCVSDSSEKPTAAEVGVEREDL